MTETDIAAGKKCPKPGCGAREIIGKPCTDWDCPQQWLHHSRVNTTLNSPQMASYDNSHVVDTAYSLKTTRFGKLGRLIEMVEKGHGPDIKLDSDIVRELGLAETCPYWLHATTRVTPMRLTSSINAVQSLFEDLMPNHGMIVSISPDVSIARIGKQVGGSVEYSAEGRNKSEARARLTAILKAVASTRQKDAEEQARVQNSPGYVFTTHERELWKHDLSSLIKHEDKDNYVEQDALSIADDRNQLREMRAVRPELACFGNQLLLNLWDDFSTYWLYVGHESNYAHDDFLRYLFGVIAGEKREISFGSLEARAGEIMANSLLHCNDLVKAKGAARVWLHAETEKEKAN